MRKNAMWTPSVVDKLRDCVMLLSITLLCGCSQTKYLDTSGRIAIPGQPAAIQVVFNPILPGKIEIQKQVKKNGIGAPFITLEDRFIALRNADQLMKLFNDGFKNKFPAMADKYGLVIANTPDGALKLTISATSMNMVCLDLGCASSLSLKGELFGKSEKALWDFSSEVGERQLDAPISNELFDSFATRLLDAMKKDGLIQLGLLR